MKILFFLFLAQVFILNAEDLIKIENKIFYNKKQESWILEFKVIAPNNKNLLCIIEGFDFLAKREDPVFSESFSIILNEDPIILFLKKDGIVFHEKGKNFVFCKKDFFLPKDYNKNFSLYKKIGLETIKINAIVKIIFFSSDQILQKELNSNLKIEFPNTE